MGGCCGGNSDVDVASAYRQRFETTFQQKRSETKSDDAHITPEVCNTKDEEEALKVISKAFREPYDPMFKWFIDGCDPKPKTDAEFKERYDLQTDYMIKFVNIPRLTKGVVLIVRDINDSSDTSKIVGVAGIQVPNVELDTVRNLLSLIGKLGAPPSQKFSKEWGDVPHERLSKMGELKKKREEIMKEYDGNYWYLGSIGVLQESRGQKRGSCLLKSLCNIADEDNLAIYLETESEENESMYKHFGFKTKEVFNFGTDNDHKNNTMCKLWLMERPPKR